MAPGFTEQLEQTLEARRARLEQHEISELKEELRVFHTAYNGIVQLLHRNSIISEDPYAHEHKISGVDAPENSKVPEGEKEHRLSSRLSYYDAMLDYVNNYYQFNVDGLSMPELKRLADMVGFWKWNQLSPHSSHYSTGLLGEQVGRLRETPDHMAVSIVNDNLNQLIRSQRKIMDLLKRIGSYRREKYKLEVRQRVTERMEQPDVSPEHIDPVVSNIKKAYKSSDLREPFYPELIREIVEEDFTERGRQLRQAKLQAIEHDSGPEENKRREQKENLKSVLLDAVRAIANSSRHLEACVEKLQESSEVYESRRRGIWVRIKRWLYRTAYGGPPPTIYNISYSDITTSARHTEEVDFHALMNEISKKAKQLAVLLNPNSRAASRLEAAGEAQILPFLTKTIEQVQMFHRTLNGLDQFFKTNTPPAQRPQIRGIKIELSSIRNSIIRANQLRHDFVARQEEAEQMRKLGVSDRGSTGA